jgi:hypothetical protein
VIRYGKQELLSSDKTTDRRDEESQDVEVGEILASIEESRVIDQKKNGDANIPCPLMEFRLVNRLHDVEEGEIGQSVIFQVHCSPFGFTNCFLMSFVHISLHSSGSTARLRGHL